MAASHQPYDPQLKDDISAALEAERRRLALHLRATLIDQLHLTLAQINAYETTATDGQSRLAFGVLHSLVRDLLQQTHDLEASLNPTALETLGLTAVLESFANQQRRATGLNVSLVLDRLRERLPAPLELALYRLTQDAVAAALRRGATQVTITLTSRDASLTFSLDDNGQPPAAGVETLQLARDSLHRFGATWASTLGRYGGACITIALHEPSPIELTEREMAVIRLLADGLTNKQIAGRLAVRPRTVKFHLDNIYSKLGVSTRTEAAVYAMQHGWTPDE